MEIDLVFVIFSLLFGACFGSFVTMASYRLPKNEDIFFKKSYCPKCNKPIRFLSLIPIFSWVFQGGKCSNCGSKISVRYPLIEIATAILFLISYLKFRNTYNTIIFDLIIVTCMIMLMADLETYIIPDSMQIVLLILSLAMVFYNDMDIYYSVISSIIYFIIIFVTGIIVEKLKKKEAIGGGDIKLITTAGILLGLDCMPIFLFMAGVFGIIFGLLWKKYTKNEYFPFGPALIISFLMTLIIIS